MKKVKSLTFILATLLIAACSKPSSVAFSSSEILSSNDVISSYHSDFISSNSEPSSSSNSSSEIVDDTHYYNGYYDTLVSWSNGEDLKNQLHAIIRNGYTAISYTKSSKQNYDTNIHADHSKYDFEYLDVIYSKNDTFKSDTNKGWQREHA